MSRRISFLLLSPLLIALLAALAPAQALTYPTDPQQALTQYNQLKLALRAESNVPAQNLAAADQSLRGQALELRGRFQSMLRWKDASEKIQYLFLLQTVEGVSLTLQAPEPLEGIRLDEPVRVLATLPADAAGNEFALHGVLRESDAPAEVAAPPQPPPTPATPPATPITVIKPPVVTPAANSIPPPTVPVWDGIPATGAGGPVSELPQVPIEQAGIDKWKAWVAKHNGRLTDLQLELTVRWVIIYSAIYGIDHRLSFAMIRAESDFNPLCRSHAGALGMTQIMYNELEDLGCKNPWNVQQNIRAGLSELSEDLRRFPDRSNYEQCILGLACYNAGPGAVKKHGGVPPYKETQNYVAKVSKQFLELVQAGYP